MAELESPRRAVVTSEDDERDPRLTVCLALLFFLTFFMGAFLLPQPPTIWGILLTMYGLLLLPTLVLAIRVKGSPTVVLKLSRPRVSVSVGALFLSFPVSVIAILIFFVQTVFFPVPPFLEELFRDLFQTIREQPILGLFAVAVSPGICEELLFRGLLLSLFERRMGALKSPIVVGVLFGVFHLEPHRFLVTTLLGILLGYLTLYSKSIIPAMLLHSSYNLWLCMPALIGEEAIVSFLNNPVVPFLFPVLLAGGIALVWLGKRS